MHFSVLALLSQDEAAIARILRENNRFNELLAKLDAAELPSSTVSSSRSGSRRTRRWSVVADIGQCHPRPQHSAMSPRELLAHQERIDAEISARVGELVDAEQRRMARLRDSITAANRDSLDHHGVPSPSPRCVLAWLCGFVISWSFILPVREAQAFLAQVAAGDFTSASPCPTATSSARWRSA